MRSLTATLTLPSSTPLFAAAPPQSFCAICHSKPPRPVLSSKMPPQCAASRLPQLSTFSRAQKSTPASCGAPHRKCDSSYESSSANRPQPPLSPRESEAPILGCASKRPSRPPQCDAQYRGRLPIEAGPTFTRTFPAKRDGTKT